MKIYYIINIINLISKSSYILKGILKHKMEIIKPIPIQLNMFDLRNERQKINNLSAIESIKKCDLSKNINLRELDRILRYELLNTTKEELLDECKNNHMMTTILGGRLAINASRQGTKDEELQINTCNITSSKCGVIIEKLTSTAFRPTKSGEVVSNKQFKEKNLSKNDCLKSFDAKISGKVNGWIFAKVVIGDGGHQDNVFEEAHLFCEWVITYGNKEELFVVLVDTNLYSKFHELREKYKNVSNILIGNHIEIQQHFIDYYYV
jgi:hypothetical protein